MIRHAKPGLAKPIVSLAYAVGSPTGLGPLVPTIGCTSLLTPCPLTARGAAIALASVTMPTDAKDCGTGTTSAWSKNHFWHCWVFAWNKH
jgi:hypothetical protein